MFENVPNILRLTLGEKSILLKDEVTVIETNVDDITGEELGYALQKIMSFGARDVSIIPIFGKKNRPSHLLRVITDVDKSEYFSNLIIQETGTLGVRIYPTSRYIQKREDKCPFCTTGFEYKKYNFQKSVDILTRHLLTKS